MVEPKINDSIKKKSSMEPPLLPHKIAEITNKLKIKDSKTSSMELTFLSQKTAQETNKHHTAVTWLQILEHSLLHFRLQPTIFYPSTMGKSSNN